MNDNNDFKSWYLENASLFEELHNKNSVLFYHVKSLSRTADQEQTEIASNPAMKALFLAKMPFLLFTAWVWCFHGNLQRRSYDEKFLKMRIRRQICSISL